MTEETPNGTQPNPVYVAIVGDRGTMSVKVKQADPAHCIGTSLGDVNPIILEKVAILRTAADILLERAFAGYEDTNLWKRYRT